MRRFTRRKTDIFRGEERPWLYRCINEMETDAEVLDADKVKAHATPDDPWATARLKRNKTGLGPYKLVKNEPGLEVVLEAARNG
jgi:hypothetical protein